MCQCVDDDVCAVVGGDEMRQRGGEREEETEMRGGVGVETGGEGGVIGGELHAHGT